MQQTGDHFGGADVYFVYNICVSMNKTKYRYVDITFSVTKINREVYLN